MHGSSGQSRLHPGHTTWTRPGTLYAESLGEIKIKLKLKIKIKNKIPGNCKGSRILISTGITFNSSFPAANHRLPLPITRVGRLRSFSPPKHISKQSPCSGISPRRCSLNPFTESGNQLASIYGLFYLIFPIHLESLGVTPTPFRDRAIGFYYS